MIVPLIFFPLSLSFFLFSKKKKKISNDFLDDRSNEISSRSSNYSIDIFIHSTLSRLISLSRKKDRIEKGERKKRKKKKEDEGGRKKIGA